MNNHNHIIRNRQIVYVASLLFLIAVFAVLSSSAVLANDVRLHAYPSTDLTRHGTEANVWLAIGISFMAIALFCSVGISFYLYRWRRILLSNPHLLVPEEFGDRILAYEKSLTQLHKSFSFSANALSNTSQTVAERLQNMIETFMTLQKKIDEQDAEIRRLKAGYDAYIYRRYLYRFLRVHQTLSDFERDQTFSESELSLLKRLLEDAMDECGVEEFSPEIGSDVREIEGVAENPKTVAIDDPSGNFQILEVREPGYLLRTSGDVNEIIVPAKVTVGVHQGRAKENEGK